VKVGPQIAPVERDRVQAVVASDQTTWQLAWRRELERAQRAQPQQPQSSKDTPHNDSALRQREDPPVVRPAAQTGDPTAATLEFKPTERGRESSEQGVGETVPEDGDAASPRGPGATREPSNQSGGSSAYALETHESPVRSPQPSGSASLDALFAHLERAAWLPKAVHVSVQGTQVGVALRDAGLTQEDVSHLLWRLRKEVRGWGLELATLVVNGEVVVLNGERGGDESF
jgi:hypothetical protein